MFGLFKKRVRQAVDEHLKNTGKEVVVEKKVTVIEHHHHYSSGEGESPRQAGSNLTDVKKTSGWVS